MLELTRFESTLLQKFGDLNYPGLVPTLTVFVLEAPDCFRSPRLWSVSNGIGFYGVGLRSP